MLTLKLVSYLVIAALCASIIVVVIIIASRFRKSPPGIGHRPKRDFFRHGDVEITLKNLIVGLDKRRIKNFKNDIAGFRSFLFDEVSSKGRYSESELPKIKKFIDMNADLLLHFAMENCTCRSTKH